MKLEPLMEYTATLEPGTIVGQGPYGLRNIVNVTGGHFKGPKMEGKIHRSGADWLLGRPDGFGKLDVRATFETNDGALIYVEYFGLLEMNQGVQNALAKGSETQYGDQRFFTQPRFETGDERYAWINQVVAVAEGRVLPGAVQYRVFQCVND